MSSEQLLGAQEIAALLRSHGFQAWFAGGCVRDSLRNVSPKDYDIVTNALPDRVAQLFPKSRSIGAHFGVMLVKKRRFDYEIATFRKDGAYLDGRRPDHVEFSSPEEDAKRRDFTVNGLYQNPETGEVIDFVGGIQDLNNRLIRAIGDPYQRFEEDYLRLLRAIRFATVLNFTIEPETWKALCDHAPQIKHISPERVREELDKMLVSPHRVTGFDLLVSSGLMEQIFPEIMQLQGCEQPPEFHPEGDVFTHTRLMLTLLEPEASLPLVLSVLFHDISKPETRTVDADTGRIRFNGHDSLGAQRTVEILKRLRYSNEVIEQVEEAVRTHMQFKDVQKMRVAKLKRFMARPYFQEELELHRIDCASSNGMLDNWHFLKEKAQEFADKQESLTPRPLLNGRDLIELGHAPGPKLGKILQEFQTLQLENQILTREEALEWAKNLPHPKMD